MNMTDTPLWLHGLRDDIFMLRGHLVVLRRQIRLLDAAIRDVRERMSRAKKGHLRGFRYNLKLRLAILTSIRLMYIQAEEDKAAQLRFRYILSGVALQE